MMRYCRIFLSLAVASMFAVGCAQQQKTATLPPGHGRIPPPTFEHFDAEQVMAAARQVLHYKGAVSLVSINSDATDRDLAGIMDGLKDIHSRREPVVFVGRNVEFISDSVSRALMRFADVDFKRLKLVVAAPSEPTKDFLDLLHSRGIEYYYVQMIRSHPPGPPSST